MKNKKIKITVDGDNAADAARLLAKRTDGDADGNTIVMTIERAIAALLKREGFIVSVVAAVVEEVIDLVDGDKDEAEKPKPSPKGKKLK